MSEPFIGEIRPFGFNFAPRGWAFCDGQLLPISQNTALFSILGTTYDGDGRTSFGLPDLRGRVPIHDGNDIRLGQKAGQEHVTLTSAGMASHHHSVNASSDAAAGNTLSGGVLAQSVDGTIYAGAANLAAMNSSDIKSTGGGGAHENMQPYLTISYCIALQGLFPSRN